MGIPAIPGVAADQGRNYLGRGEAGFVFDFGRSWQARAYYTRGVEFIQELTQPAIADAANVELLGHFNRRLDILLSAGYSSGDSAINATTRLFDAYKGDVRLRYAFTRKVAAYFEGFHYVYEIDQTLLNLPRNADRSGVRVGLMLLVPVVGR